MREGDLDAARIERELDATRSRLDATLGSLQDKLAPASLADQAVTYFKEVGGVELARSFSRSMRDNPIPVAMIGVGLGWLVFSGARRSDSASANGWRDRPWVGERRFGGSGFEHDPHVYDSARQSRSMPYEAAAYDDLATKARRAGLQIEREEGEAEEDFEARVQDARGAVLGMARDAGEAVASFRQRVERALVDAAGSVRSFVADAGERAEHLVDRTQAAARDAYDYGRDATSDMRRRAGVIADQARGMGGRTVDYMQDQPLLLGAIGITVGAVVGMMVPATRTERNLVGAVRENLEASARHAVGEAGERVARVAESVVGTAQSAARREGFVPGNGEHLLEASRERVADVAGRARQVVEETSAAGLDAVRRELSADREHVANGEPRHSSPGATTSSHHRAG